VNGRRHHNLTLAVLALAALSYFPAESGFTTAFAMGAVAVGCAMLAATLIPARRVSRVARRPAPRAL
jgi:ABC-type antimicrobial peptide transport system permease subunit